MAKATYNGEELPSKLIEDALKYVMQGIATNMAMYGRNASGASVRGMKVVMESPEHGYLASPNFSFRVMERGRKSGKIPSNFINIIEKWITDKGITVSVPPNGDAEKAKRRVAGAIAYSIAKNGTRLHRSGGMDDIFTTNINVATANLGVQLMNWASVKIDRIMQEERK